MPNYAAVGSQDDGAAAAVAEWPTTEQEQRIGELFGQLDKLLKKAEKIKDPDKLHNVMKTVTTKLKESKALLKDFEREARADDMPAPVLAQRKKVLADRLNQAINRKRDITSSIQKDDLFAGAAQPEEANLEEMTTQQLVQKGRKDMAATDAALNRAERLVEDTLATGTQTAAVLGDQTKQLNKIVDDLADIEFNVKKASKVITDITRGLLTDKCIGFLLFMAVAGVIAIIVLKVVNPNKKNISEGISTINNATGIGDTVSNLVDSATNSVSGAVNNAVDSLPGSSPSPTPSSSPATRRMLRDAVRLLVSSPEPQLLVNLLMPEDAW